MNWLISLTKKGTNEQFYARKDAILSIVPAKLVPLSVGNGAVVQIKGLNTMLEVEEDCKEILSLLGEEVR